MLRAPLLPFDTLVRWADGVRAPSAPTDELVAALAHDRALLRPRLLALVAQPHVRDALFAASPDLDAALDRHNGAAPGPDDRGRRRLERTLARFVGRMSARATPLGMLATCTLGEIGVPPALELAPDDELCPRSRIALQAVATIAEHAAADAACEPVLQLHPGDGLHRVAGRLHHVEPAGSHHRLVALEETEELRTVLARARAGATAGALAAALAADPEIDLAEARAFIRELVEAGVLVHELRPAVTGPDAAATLEARLHELSVNAVATALGRSRRALETLDAAPAGGRAAATRLVAAALSELGASGPPERLVRLDTARPARALRIPPAAAAELGDAAGLLARMTDAAPPPEIERFAARFTERYGLRELALLTALDPELGVGFDAARESGGVPWDGRDERRLELIDRARRSGTLEVELDADDLRALQTEHHRALPSSFAVVASIAARDGDALEAGDFALSLSHVQGPSGARMLGRLCHALPALLPAVERHLLAEERLDADAVFAEVVHEPLGAAADVVARPAFRDYEIACLGRGSRPPDRRLGLDDLLVSIRGGRPVLRSRRLGRRVIPRLTAAHNVYSQGIPAYGFLVQLQDLDGPGWLEWDWGPLRAAPFTPRVRVGRVVLARATWRLTEGDIAKLRDAADDDRFAALQALRHDRGLPRFAGLADGDRVLWTDFDNALAVDALADELKTLAAATLVELWPGPGELCARSPHGRYVHELIVPFTCPAPKAPEPAADSAGGNRAAPAVRRAYPPASEWLTFSFYAGPATVDVALREEVAPLARRLVADGVADSWFFVRYDDGDWHLRVRLHGDPADLHAHAVGALQSVAAGLIDAGRLRTATIDTYEPEVERYGGPWAIGLAERAFHVDSDAAAKLLAAVAGGDAGAEQRWLVTLAGADALVDDLGLEPDAAVHLLQEMHDIVGDKLGLAPGAGRALAGDFRRRRAELATLLERPAEHEVAFAWPILAERSRRLRPIAEALAALERDGRLTLARSEIAASLVHMWANRMLRQDHLKGEFVLYDHLARVRAGRLARARATVA